MPTPANAAAPQPALPVQENVEYIWRCCECGDTYEEHEVIANKCCCAPYETIRKEATGMFRDNDDRVLSEVRDTTKQLLREDESSPVPARIA
eukprot:10625929-Karenia_brevis.AAC.1